MASKPRILLLIPSSSYRAEAFLDAARRLDVAVTVGSDHRQVLADFAPASSVYLRFGQVEHSVTAIRAFAQRFPLSAIIGTDDDALELAATASRALGLAHNAPQAVRAAGDKWLFRELTARAGIASPRCALVDRNDDALAVARRIGYPCVLKPRSLAASRGVIRADDNDGCALAARRIFALLEVCYPPGHTHRDSLLIEQYLPGREFAIDGLLHEGRFEALAVFDKPDPLHGPYFEETLFVRPARAPRAVLDAILDTIVSAAAALGLERGPLHAELRFDDGAVDARPMLLEIAPRSIGGRCSNALGFDRGVSLEGLILEAALGRTHTPASRHEPTHPASGVMMLPIAHSGVLRAVRGVPQARAVAGISAIDIAVHPGEHIHALPEGDRYLGFLFANATHADAVEAILREAHACLDFDIEASKDA